MLSLYDIEFNSFANIQQSFKMGKYISLCLSKYAEQNSKKTKTGTEIRRVHTVQVSAR